MIYNCSTSAGGVERFEKLHVGGDDKRCIPVFAGQPRFGGFLLRVHIGLAVMLNGHVAQGAEDVAKHLSSLLDNARVRNGIDHPLLAASYRMLQRKRQA